MIAFLLTQIAKVKAAITATNTKITEHYETVITDLNAPLIANVNVPVINVYAATAENKPTGNGGFTITVSLGTWRQQTAFELAGEIYSRYYNGTTFSDWVKRST